MNIQINELNKKFLTIKKQGWIKALRNSTSGIGYTFETLIGKEEENFPIPDYKGIEIKTSRISSWGKIHLFHATPDGEYLFPIKDILEKLGYPDKDFPEYNVFNYSVNAKGYTKTKENKKVKIKVDRKNKELVLIAKDQNNKNINIHVKWSFDMLKKRIELKLKYLSIIKAKSKRVNNIEYFNYDKINFYKLKDFDTFINLIELGIIKVTFMIGLHKKGKRFGKIHDRGTAFTINEKQVELLYDKYNL